MPETVIQVKDLKVHFPVKKGILSSRSSVVHAVDGISFKLRKGETLGVVGESGCGKSTAGLAVMNLIKPTAGSIYWNGSRLSDFKGERLRKARRNVQIIFQDPYSSLNPRMTVNQILSDPMDIHRMYRKSERADRLAFLLETVGLAPESGERYPHEFSGGQRQRLGIARALALNPSVIIGDEPVSALDVSIQAQIINLLIKLRRDFDLSMIIISHDLSVVEHICDRIIVMYLGRIVEAGTYASIYGNPKHPYTQALLSAVPSLDPRKKKKRIILTGDIPSPIDPPPGCRFSTRCPKCLDVCREKEPPTIDLGGGHEVCCHLFCGPE